MYSIILSGQFSLSSPVTILFTPARLKLVSDHTELQIF